MTDEPSLPDVAQRVTLDSCFSGVVRIDVAGEPSWTRAHGLADRAHGVAMQADTRIAVASGGKAITALTVLRLVDVGRLALGTRARELLGADLPSVGDAVTVEQLLAHRSGIGDYFDEDAAAHPDDPPLAVPVHRLVDAEDYLPLLDGRPAVAAPGAEFAYCNAGYVLLAVLAQRAAGEPFHDLARRLVLEPAGLRRTGYLRSDALPGDAALGYLHPPDHPDRLRTHVHHLPVVGGGDGGVYTTADDVAALWDALDAGRVVAPDTWAAMRQARTADTGDGRGYGLGCWLLDGAVMLVGSDAGASFTSLHVRGVVTWSVLSNTTAGAWPLVRALREATGAMVSRTAACGNGDRA